MLRQQHCPAARAFHCLSRRQYTGPVANADGSVDIYFGPQAPKGKEKNWIKSVPSKGWFPYLRFYSPTEAFFDKSSF